MMLPAKILLICADVTKMRTISTCLTQEGYKVVHSPRGSGAIDLVHLENPALVILDVDLPDYNSLAIIRLLRVEESQCRLPVILIGDSLTEQDVLIGLEVGADLCLLETFHPQVFIARLRSLLRRSELQKTH